MKARYAATCPRCTLPYEVGEEIDKLQPEDAWGHRVCPGTQTPDEPEVPDDLPYPLPVTPVNPVDPANRLRFALGRHIHLGEEQDSLDWAGRWRWRCSCGAKGTWQYEEGRGWHLWLGHVIKKTSGTDWESYHMAKALRDLP